MPRLLKGGGHHLEGRMHHCTASEIAGALKLFPATATELMMLALEEMRRPAHLGGDRADVYRVLQRFKR